MDGVPDKDEILELVRELRRELTPKQLENVARIIAGLLNAAVPERATDFANIFRAMVLKHKGETTDEIQAAARDD